MGVISHFNLKNFIEHGFDVFIETGSGTGTGIRHAASLPFKKIYSVEIDAEQAESLRQTFAGDKRIKIFDGLSPQFLENLFAEGLIGKTDKCVFWLDAHFPSADLLKRAYDDEKDLHKRLPLEDELDVLWRHERFHDVIIADDLRIYKKLDIQGGDLTTIGLGNLTAYDRDFFTRWRKVCDVQEYAIHEGYLVITPKRMNIVLLSFYTKDFQSLADVTLPGKQEYCDRWGYTHVVHVPEKLVHYYAVDRIKYLRDLLFETENDFDFAWVLNGHAMIMNHTINVAQYLDDEHDFFITRDVNALNAGSFLIRKSEWGKKWLDMIYREAPHVGHGWHENMVIVNHENDPVFKDKIKVLPHPSINNYLYKFYDWPDTTPGNFKKGDFVLHIPGRPVQYPNGELRDVRANIFKSKEIQDMIVR